MPKTKPCDDALAIDGDQELVCINADADHSGNHSDGEHQWANLRDL